MARHETKTCVRCRRDFECKSGSILLCQCQTVVLSPAQLAWIAVRYDDCLCCNCLKQLRTEYNHGKFDGRLRKLQAREGK